MTVKTKYVGKGKVNLCLPVFSADETAEAELMNYFYDSLGEIITAFADTSPHIRRYSVSFMASDESGKIEIKLNLCARVLDNFGSVILQKREIVTIWRGCKLTITKL
ncbi:MAG: hypothetical protein IKM46_04395 [Clostridia bacterium]|nr:hypothetical protein [Clostridia bacterium]